MTTQFYIDSQLVITVNKFANALDKGYVTSDIYMQMTFQFKELFLVKQIVINCKRILILSSHDQINGGWISIHRNAK